MRRKIIKQGHNTLTITLPSDWTKRLSLNAGDEIDIIERDNGLFLSSEIKGDKRSTSIDIRGLDIPTIWKYMMAVYREGYDEVKIYFDSEDRYHDPFKSYKLHEHSLKEGKQLYMYTALEAIHIITNRFIGFEVIETYKDHCILHDMAEPTSKEFDGSLRRVFLLIQQMSEEMKDAIKKNDVSLIEHTEDVDISVDKFHDYCIRVLNKTGFKDVRKSHLMFTTLYLLELIGDEFKHIAHRILQDFKNKPLSNLLEVHSMVNKQVNDFYELFYTFDKNKVPTISQRDFDIHFYVPKQDIAKKKRQEFSQEELRLFSYYRRIGHYLNALLELRIEMEY